MINNFQNMCIQCKKQITLKEVAFQDNSRAVYICCQCHIGGLVYHHQCPDGCFQVATPEELIQLQGETTKL